jgi:hypothetical protein
MQTVSKGSLCSAAPPDLDDVAASNGSSNTAKDGDGNDLLPQKDQEQQQQQQQKLQQEEEERQRKEKEASLFVKYVHVHL